MHVGEWLVGSILNQMHFYDLGSNPTTFNRPLIFKFNIYFKHRSLFFKFNFFYFKQIIRVFKF